MMLEEYKLLSLFREIDCCLLLTFTAQASVKSPISEYACGDFSPHLYIILIFSFYLFHDKIYADPLQIVALKLMHLHENLHLYLEASVVTYK